MQAVSRIHTQVRNRNDQDTPLTAEPPFPVPTLHLSEHSIAPLTITGPAQLSELQ